MSDELRNAKRALRADLRQRRRVRTMAARADATRGLTDELIALVAEIRPRSLSCYLSAQDEPDTRPFLDWAARQPFGVLLPVSREDGLLDWAFDDRSEAVGRHGMPEPAGQRLGPLALEEVDLVLAPAAAVDRHGYRLGWGRGYFDRTLAGIFRRAPVYAIVFDEEVIDEVPREDHDQPVDGAVTPSARHRFGGATYPGSRPTDPAQE